MLLAALVAACDAAPADDRRAPATLEAAAPQPHERIDVPSLIACGGCHTDVFAEWSQSLHHRAWTNANARTATKDFQIESCRPCHSPHSVFETGFDRRPEYRDFNQADGVHCLSCHGLGDGVAAARTLPDAPCKPRFDARMVAADQCYPCHEPTHHAFAEYEESDAFALGIRCADCHMPIVARADGRTGRSHGPHGGMNAEFVKKGLRWRAAVAGGAVVVELANRTGHRFPGEIPSRALLVSVRFDGGAWTDLLLRKPNKGEAREDDRLQPDEVRRVRFEPPPGAREAEVRVLFRPLPLLAPEACHDLGTVLLRLP
jgi:hypothetical protein